MENSIEYLNNFSLDKIIYDETLIKCNNVSKSHIKDTVICALDTENTNYKNERCITYATQLMKFGKKTAYDSKLKLTKPTDRKMNIFTHPKLFWEYIVNSDNQRYEMYVFNAEYDVNNLLNFAIKEYNLKEYIPNITEIEEYEGLYKQENIKLNTSDTFVYTKISRNGKIYKLDVQFGQVKSGKNIGIKRITILDMSKKLPGNLKGNVEGFTSLKMNKNDLDYSIFRDYGHRNYSENELLYMWNDVYCLCDLIIEYVFSGKYVHTEKLTTSSMALACYKDKLLEDIIISLDNKNHTLHKLAKKYYDFCKKSKIEYMLHNSDQGKYKKLFEKYNLLLMQLGEKEGTKQFILDNYFTSKEVFSNIFPSLNYDEFEYAISSYCGGITRFHHKKDVGNWINEKGMGIDINSSFPYSYTTFKLPYGVPTFKNCKGDFKLKESKLYIIRFQVNSFKIKANKEPNIAKNMLNIPNISLKNCDTWIKEYNSKCIITCTSVDYVYFMENYSFDNLKVLDYQEYNCTNGLFTNFTKTFYGIKQTSTDTAMVKWAKLILNGVYGKFGQNKTAELRHDEYNVDSNSIEDVIDKQDGSNIELLSEGVYLPIASFVTSYSRVHLLTVLNIINDTKNIDWRYCDTDSAYVTGDVDVLKTALVDYIDIDYTGNLGLWKIEKYFDRMLIIGIKKYIYFGGKYENKDYSYHATLSGINSKYFRFIENYCNINDECIGEISSQDRLFINLVNDGLEKCYVSNDQNNPFIYKDKDCTQMIKGAYRSIRKKTVIDGQILFNTIYCIKGEI